jgi:hypothetical protein
MHTSDVLIRRINMKKQNMVRTNLYFSQKQHEFLLKTSKEEGVSFAEIVRSVVQKMLDDKAKLRK